MAIRPFCRAALTDNPRREPCEDTFGMHRILFALMPTMQLGVPTGAWVFGWKDGANQGDENPISSSCQNLGIRLIFHVERSIFAMSTTKAHG